MNKFYITTAIPYVNGRPHIGHTLEYFQADLIRRYRKLKGDETLLLSGADENALKNVNAAKEEGLPVKDYLDKYSKIWADTYNLVGVDLDVFQRGSDAEKHWPGVQKLWKLCEDAGDIYKKSYKGLYCVGCESFKTTEELEEGICPIHKTKPDEVSEENYFFKLSKFQDKLIELIESDTLKISPSNKRAEALSFIKQGLEDFSVSRSNERAQGVGVPVPGDPDQKIYVWFDALNIYMTGVGFGWDEEKWNKWWPADLHVIGKDINRFHTVYWPAMLLSAFKGDLDKLPKQILIHGFVNARGGEKFSKSLQNAPSPKEVIDKYGLEALRYYLLSQVPIDADHDFTFDRFEEVYNADLANGLGNLVARVAKLCERVKIGNIKAEEIPPEYDEALNSFRFNEVLSTIWDEVRSLDKYIEEKAPWKVENETELKDILEKAAVRLLTVAIKLKPFLPETSENIEKQFSGKEIKAGSPLFPRV